MRDLHTFIVQKSGLILLLGKTWSEFRGSDRFTKLQVGAIFNAKATTTIVSGLVLADNRLGLVTLPVCGETGAGVQCSVEVSDIWLIGASNSTECSQPQNQPEPELCDLPQAASASQSNACSSR